MTRRMRSVSVSALAAAVFLLSACGGHADRSSASEISGVASGPDAAETSGKSGAAGASAGSPAHASENASKPLEAEGDGTGKEGGDASGTAGEATEEEMFSSVGEPLDDDARKAAQTAIEAVKNKDLRALGACAGFPLYVDTGDGLEVTSEEEFLSEFTPDQIFTEEFTDAVTGTDLDRVRAADGGAVLSRDGGRPDLVLTLTDDGWCVTDINVTP